MATLVYKFKVLSKKKKRLITKFVFDVENKMFIWLNNHQISVTFCDSCYIERIRDLKFYDRMHRPGALLFFDSDFNLTTIYVNIWEHAEKQKAKKIIFAWLHSHQCFWIMRCCSQLGKCYFYITISFAIRSQLQLFFELKSTLQKYTCPHLQNNEH